ncbi:membrane dipeptidase [Telmatospirillum sp.]|uniref:dipeptidase n=1 Tax=Telmatospirillum sp. TaxID=2079197 RepID=UPI002847DAF0|nr:membrane dipeptidase [Telmatospirillum sp.]MDR3438848.1 membrane dipeptidase [Telmatospirillum sp.]
MTPPDLSWGALFRAEARPLDGQVVTIDGWMMPFDAESDDGTPSDYFLIVPEPACCGGCAASDPFGCIEAFAAAPLVRPLHPTRFSGRLICLTNDRLGYAYQLRDVVASPIPDTDGSAPSFQLSRRHLLKTAGATLALAACASGGLPSSVPPERRQTVEDVLSKTVTIDIHSHAGRVLSSTGSLYPVAPSMRSGGMSAIGLAMTGDWGTVRQSADGKRFEAFRQPEPGELYFRSQQSFARIQNLIDQDGLAVILGAGDFRTGRAGRPAVIVSAEGADFLDTDIDRVDEAYERYHLRHLQLTHYRVNSLGDIQTAAPVHGGLTPFGAEVIRRCNRLGIVVDVAHGTFDLVKQAAETTSKPLVLSHSSLADKPGPRSRTINAQHARLIADTGGVIGIWPISTVYPDMAAYAKGIARIADVIGVDHVGLGSDQLGLLAPSVFDDYEQLPQIADALLTAGFTPEETGKILGGNYARVFAQSVGT